MRGEQILEQAKGLSKRSISSLFRQPQSWLPGFFFPVLLALVYTSQFSGATSELPGFALGDGSFLNFLLPASILQGISFGATNGASDLAVDIEQGFFDRLLVSPVNRLIILLGRMAGTAVWALVQTIVLVSIFMALGARIEGGILAFLILLVCAVLLSLFIGSFAMGLALRTGSEEVVQSIFPMIFVFLFISSAFFPTQAMSGWYRWLAEINPITYIIDPLRRMVLIEFTLSDALQSIVIVLGLAILTIGFALYHLRGRLSRH